jgi:hypothetical protein
LKISADPIEMMSRLNIFADPSEIVLEIPADSFSSREAIGNNGNRSGYTSETNKIFKYFNKINLNLNIQIF